MQTNPKHWLESEYLQRKKKNPSYSLRAFSRLLDLPSGRVSQLLSEKRNITPSVGKKVALRLGYDPVKTRHFLSSIECSRKSRCQPPVSSDAYAPLDMDQFQSIAEPLHFAILSLMETRGFSGKMKEISQRLDLGSVETRAAVERLQRLGLVETEPRIRLAKNPGLTTSHDVQSSALRVAHKKVLEEAIASLEDIAVELRDITSITMAADPSKLAEAKRRLREFRRSFSEFMETGTQTEVYRLNIQLVPVTKRKKT